MAYSTPVKEDSGELTFYEPEPRTPVNLPPIQPQAGMSSARRRLAQPSEFCYRKLRLDATISPVSSRDQEAEFADAVHEYFGPNFTSFEGQPDHKRSKFMQLAETGKVLALRNRNIQSCYRSYAFNFHGRGYAEVDSNQQGLGMLDQAKDDGYYRNIYGVTMYNENFKEIKRTLVSLIKNQSAFEADGSHAPSRNLAVIVVDGLAALYHADELDPLDQPSPYAAPKRLLREKLAKYRLFSEALIQEREELVAGPEHYSRRLKDLKDGSWRVNDYAYTFESCLRLLHWPEQKRWKLDYQAKIFPVKQDTLPGKGPRPSVEYLDVLFVVKQTNQHKLHSHLWIYYGFCLRMQPKYIYLIDIGTQPWDTSLYDLKAYMEKRPEVSGCCGEIILDEHKNGLMWAQWFEFKFSHALLKPFESVCGFIPVLPGAFSMYRWSALLVDDCKVMKEYFKQFSTPQDMDYIDWNMYLLAEDRVKAERLVKLREPSRSTKCCNRGHYLKFVKEAKASTEGKEDFVELMKQRRRWNNGSWFALVKVISPSSLHELARSSHHGWALTWLLLQYLYNTLLALTTWFALGVYYVAFSMAVRRIFDKDSMYFDALQLGFLFVQLAVIFISLSVKLDSVPKWFWKGVVFYYFCNFLFVLTVLVTFVFLLKDVDDDIGRYGIYTLPTVIVVALILYFEDFWKCLWGSLWFFYYLPSYVNVLLLFSVTQIDDISWGNQAASKDSNDKYRTYKVIYLTAYLTSNVTLGLTLENIDEAHAQYMTILYAFGVAIFALPAIALLFFHISYWCRGGPRCCKRRAKTTQMPKTPTV